MDNKETDDISAVIEWTREVPIHEESVVQIKVFTKEKIGKNK